jgi:ATP-dependent Clp protease ATP-binding subunit ClpC
VYNILLQVLDDGQLTDGLGRKVDFKNTLIIMTSNIGVRQLKDFGQGVGFATKARQDAAEDNSKTVIQNALKRTFSPEFLNRIDDVMVFNALVATEIFKIIDNVLAG